MGKGTLLLALSVVAVPAVMFFAIAGAATGTALSVFVLGWAVAEILSGP